MNKGIEKAHEGMITVLAVMLILLVTAVGTASAASEWDAVFGGDGTDNAYSVEQTDDGGYILTGYKAFPDRKVWLIKTDSSGVREWDRAFGGDSSWGHSVRQTNDSGYIVTGFTETYGAGMYDVWLIKTDSSGTESWNKTFGNADQDYGKSVRQTSDGGYIVAGSTDIQIGSGTQYAAWLIKTDFTGKEDWNQTYDYDTGMDEFYSVQQTSDGGYIAAGYSKNTTTGGRYGVWLLRTDSNGNELWNKTFGKADETDYGHEVRIEEISGGYIIGGRTKSYGAGSYDFWLIKTDSNGDELWNQTYGGSDSDSGYSMAATNDGGYILAGNTKSYGAGKYDFWLVKTDSNGNCEWDMTFGGSEDDGAYSVDVTDDGSYVIAGYTKSSDPGNKDIWLIHTEGPACVGENYGFTCGDVVNESCTFNADLTCPAATAGLIIGADGITIDGAGYKITGDLTGATCDLCDATNPCTVSGIYNAGYDNVAIENLEVEGFCTGISLKGTGPNNVRNITINNCEIHDNGLNTGNEIGTHGIHACWIDVGDGGESAITITNNDIYNNEGTGSGCGSGGNGVLIVAGAGDKHEKAVISHNNLYDNAKAGFWTKAGLDQSEIACNEVWGNGDGAGITDDTRGGIILKCKASNRNNVSHNDIHDHSAGGHGYGIFVGGGNNTIEYNNVTNNTMHGISMFRSDGSYDNELYENTVCDNGVYDLYVWSSTARNHGDNNTCDKPDSWNDADTTGCTYPCAGEQPYYCDSDNDTYISATPTGTAAELPPGCQWEVGDDCDDTNPDVNPGAAENCTDGIDNDCDGLIDDDDPDCGGTQPYYCDSDSDGYFNITPSGTATELPPGCQWGVGDDCDDANPDVNPGAAENCTDGIDNDCDGLIDDDDPDCAPHKVFFVPGDIRVPQYCNTRNVGIWIETTDVITSGQMEFEYASCCMNVTDYEINSTYWIPPSDMVLTPGKVKIILNAAGSGVGPGLLHIGNITVHCCNETSYCFTDLDWNDDPGVSYLFNNVPAKIDIGWMDATFRCNIPDLAVTQVKGDEINETHYSVSYAIKNIGDVDAAASHSSLTVDGSPVETMAVPALSAGEEQTYTFTSEIELVGDFDMLEVCADYNDMVVELDESNNCLPARYPGEVAISVMPEITYVQPQDQFDVKIRINPKGMEVYAVQYYLTYDTSVVRAETQTKGPFLGGTPDTIVVVNEIDQPHGEVAYAETRKIDGGVTVEDNVTNIHFIAIGPRGATTTLHIDRVVISDPDGNAMGVEMMDGDVEITVNTPPVPISVTKHRVNNVAQKYQSTAILCSCSYDPDYPGKGGNITYIRWAFGDGQYGTSEGLPDENNCTCKEHRYESWQWDPLGVPYNPENPEAGGNYVPFDVRLDVMDDGCPELTNNTNITIDVFIAGDANGDGEVNILDAVWVGKNWRAECEPCNPYPDDYPETLPDYCGCDDCEGNYWNDAQAENGADGADLNNDCEINILDAVIIGANWRHVAW